MIRTLLVAALLWSVLTGANLDSWIVGVPVLIVTTWVASFLPPPGPLALRPLGLVRFGLHFLFHSLAGAVDVAWRSLDPRLPIDPGIVEYRVTLQPLRARLFFLGVINLLPGSVSAELRDQILTVHVIDVQRPVRRHLRSLESVIAGIWALPLTESDAEEHSRD